MAKKRQTICALPGCGFAVPEEKIKVWDRAKAKKAIANIQLVAQGEYYCVE